MPLAVVTSAHDFRRACQEARVDGELALVPTMGYLHAGHQSLIKNAAQRAPAVAVTIFVNPSQFAPGEDLARYPRDLPGDLRKCEEAGATFVFAPTHDAELYPPGFQTHVEPGPLAAPMEGEKRPGHFRGVCTVVAKLFALSRADAAFFGEKDYQQLRVIQQMALDLNFGTEVKSLRDGSAQLSDSYAIGKNGELWLFNAQIPPYKPAGPLSNHEPKRTRKLLLHRREIERLSEQQAKGGYALIPLSMYFKDGRVKVEIGVCKGKTSRDKRDTIAEREAKREMDRARRR